MLSNSVKTVKYPRLIFLSSGESERLSEIISGILNCCSYSTSVGKIDENADYIISNSFIDFNDEVGIMPDTAFADRDEIRKFSMFRRIVTSYEEAAEGDEADDRLLTYSLENYSADVSCRNISVQGDSTVFDILSGGILSRVRINSSIYSVRDVLVCTSVLIATGVPIAAILSFFNN